MTQVHGREQQLTAAFVELADTLVDDYDVIDVLDRLVAHSVAVLAAEAAGIMLIDPHGRLNTVAYSGRESGWAELMQLQTDEGPCIDCVRSGEPVTVTDLDTAAAHWPRFTAALHERITPEGRFRSVHALPLRLRGQAIGALNLFHTRPGPLPAADLLLGQALADIATIGILQERLVRHGRLLAEQLQNALDSRVVIEQAKGVLAQSGNLSMDGAFDRLRNHARRNNLRLSEVARRIVGDRDAARQLLDVPTRQRA